MRRLSSLRVDVVPSDASRGLLTIALPVWPSPDRLSARARLECAELLQTGLAFAMRSKTTANIPGTTPISLLCVRGSSLHRFE